jgi:hypothetical protein
VLFGANPNARVTRTRELAAGEDAHEEIQLPPRSKPKEKVPPR